MKIRITISILIALWCIGFFFEWLIPLNEKLLTLLPFLHQTYSLVCHQEKVKLIASQGFESLVCSRCAGIYIGFLAGSLVSLFKPLHNNPDIKVLSVCFIIMLLDIAAYSVGIYHYSKLIAFITGFLLGSVAFSYFYIGLIHLFTEIKKPGLN
jgi:uncharacterized membrane protein